LYAAARSAAGITQYLFAEVPREIRASVLPILLAAALLFVPAAIAGTAVFRNPSVAEAFLPPGMLDRAEGGVRRAKTGDGYIDDPQLFRPVMATQIITNNVQVAMAAFAFGVTAGLLTVYLLVSNGISLGLRTVRLEGDRLASARVRRATRRARTHRDLRVRRRGLPARRGAAHSGSANAETGARGKRAPRDQARGRRRADAPRRGNDRGFRLAGSVVADRNQARGVGWYRFAVVRVPPRWFGRRYSAPRDLISR
jgi:hypothetical protein